MSLSATRLLQPALETADVPADAVRKLMHNVFGQGGRRPSYAMSQQLGSANESHDGLGLVHRLLIEVSPHRSHQLILKHAQEP